MVEFTAIDWLGCFGDLYRSSVGKSLADFLFSFQAEATNVFPETNSLSLINVAHPKGRRKNSVNVMKRTLSYAKQFTWVVNM